MKIRRALPLLASTVVAAHGGEHEGPSPEDLLNEKFARMMLWVGGCTLAFFLIWAAIIRFSAHIRRLTSLSGGSQKYFVSADSRWAWLKRHFIYAPMFRTRHNRELRISSALNIGTLPSRFQTALLLGVIAMNVTLCCVTIDYGTDDSTLLGTIRNRSGTMAVVNLIPMVIMAGRNNPLIQLLDVSFDTWNLLHRWLGRIVALETITHVVAWMINKVNTSKFSLRRISCLPLSLTQNRGLGRRR